jgi:hypothetical protein
MLLYAGTGGDFEMRSPMHDTFQNDGRPSHVVRLAVLFSKAKSLPSIYDATAAAMTCETRRFEHQVPQPPVAILTVRPSDRLRCYCYLTHGMYQGTSRPLAQPHEIAAIAGVITPIQTFQRWISRRLVSTSVP